jgi:hypothetical protein
MRHLRILLSFLRFTVAKKIAFYYAVITKMTGNPSFPTPDVPLAVAKTAVDNYQVSNTAAMDGSKLAKTVLRDKEQIVDEIFRKLAMYVERIADGDQAKILSSGFSVASTAGQRTKPEFAIVNGSVSGSVKLTVKAVPGAKAYIWQKAKGGHPETEEGWGNAGYSTQTSIELTDLEIACKYYFRVAAITPDGVLDFCSPIMKIIE